MIVFSESAETVGYLYEGLQAEFPGQVMAFSSGGGMHNDVALGKEPARRLIEANYAPRHHQPRDDVRILITTDVLAEGINLHRSNIVVNYDLPWNPTRVLQRVGRVNRVGTAHPQIYVFNFFPTSQSDEQIGLEANIIAKIQAFHDMLGEDARYLSEEEEVTQHDLRGKVLYRKLVSKETYEGEEGEEESDLEYLQVIRQVRDDDEALFEKIKRLPQKARAGWDYDAGGAVPAGGAASDGGNDQLVTFFRVGKLKKFFVSTVHETREVDFFDAVDLMKCEADQPSIRLPKIYYALLAQNKTGFDAVLQEDNAPKAAGGGHTNTQLALKNIRAAQKDNKKMTDEEEAYLRAARQAFEDGRIPRKTSQRIMQRIKKEKRTISGLRILSILQAELDDDILSTRPAQAERPGEKREIILSAYLLKQPTE